MRGIRPLDLEMLGGCHDRDPIDDALVEQLTREPEGERGLAGAGRRRDEEVAVRLAARYCRERVLLARPATWQPCPMRRALGAWRGGPLRPARGTRDRTAGCSLDGTIPGGPRAAETPDRSTTPSGRLAADRHPTLGIVAEECGWPHYRARRNFAVIASTRAPRHANRRRHPTGRGRRRRPKVLAPHPEQPDGANRATRTSA